MMRLTSRITVVVGLVLGVGACKFPELPPIDEDGAPGDGSAGDGAPGDGGDPDAATVCVPEAESCADGRYTRCDATGNFVQHLIPNGGASGEPITITMDDYECPMGCHTTAPRCADIDTLNVVNAALDNGVSATGTDVVLPLAGSPDGTIALDTGPNGQFDSVAAEVRITDTGGGTIRIPAEVLTQSPPAPAVLVLKTRTFTLRAGSTLRLDGARALAIASHFDVRIEGVLDGSGQPGVAEQGAGPGSLGDSASCVGQWMSFVSGGAGNMSNGGRSSNGLTGGGLHPAGPPALAGGCAGSGQVGGGGGIQLASRTRIALASTAQIDVSGGGGRRAHQRRARRRIRRQRAAPGAGGVLWPGRGRGRTWWGRRGRRTVRRRRRSRRNRHGNCRRRRRHLLGVRDGRDRRHRDLSADERHRLDRSARRRRRGGRALPRPDTNRNADHPGGHDEALEQLARARAALAVTATCCCSSRFRVRR